MSSLFLHTGNRLGDLATVVARSLAEVKAEPLGKELVVVPSLALRRWLTLELARINGVCANVEFPFLGDFISSLPERLVPPKILSRRADPEQTLWRIHELLPSLLHRKEFNAVRAYLSDADPLKRYQLAARLAALFDQYIVYRTEMLDRWESGTSTLPDEEKWQAVLWRETMPDNACVLGQSSSSNGDFAAASVLPKRIFVFGFPEMPPVYLGTLFRAAAEVPVHLFQLRPSREYFGDELTPKQRLRRKIDSSEPPAVNPLLASLGQTSSHFTELLLETDERFGHLIEERAEKFSGSDGEGLLATLQRDILTAVNRGASADASSKIGVHADDRSIALHSCHSAMREVEVLYDQLLSFFAADQSLRPRDILVMAPEIEKYSPLVHAVFGYPEKDERKIPYSISDRQARSESVAIDTFLSLLDLSTSRCTAPEVYGIISSELLAARFGLSPADLALVHTWIYDSGICWGIDGKHRQELGLPATEANTWRFGLNRLLLGYAVRGENRTLFEGILPYDEIEGDGGELLGRFVAAVDAVLGFVADLQLVRSLADWGTLLRTAIARLLDSEDDEHVRDLRFLRKTVSRLETIAGDPEVGITVLRRHLDELLGQMQQRGSFLTGGVTFCALKPGRSIPARAICLLGMNDDVFPRRPQPAQFDLMAKPQLGDPSPRQDDRYAFLETLCAAGERLHISYLGRSIVDNQEIPPSVVISELLDYVGQAFDFSGDASARSSLIVEHPLQAFSWRYFSEPRADSRLFSHSEANAAAAAASAQPFETSVRRPFLTKPLLHEDGRERSLDLQQLVRFLSAPSQFFLKEQFHVDLREFDAALPEDEPLELGALDEYQIRQELLAEWVDRGEPDLEVFAARGLTAPGEVGKLQLRCLNRETGTFRAAVVRHIGGAQKDEPVVVDLRRGEFSLTGYIESRYGGRVVHYRCANLKIKDMLRAWIDHLAFAAAAPKEARETILIGRDKVISWAPVPDSAELLRDLCELYAEASIRPLPLFPISGLAYVKAHLAGRNSATAVWKVWAPYRGDRKERDDASIQMLFGSPDPLAAESVAAAMRVFSPMLSYSSEEEAE